MSLLYEGKAKRVYEDAESRTHVIVEFTDNVTAGDGEKKEVIPGKGALACETTHILFSFLNEKGVETHYEKRVDDTRLQCLKVEIFPVEVVCRNVAAGSLCRRYGIERGRIFSPPIIEFFLKDDALHDPLITRETAIALNLVTSQELAFMESVTRAANYYLCQLFKQVDLSLIDFKLEFGKTPDGRILVADELSGDTMRLWTLSGESMDKDLFREASGDLLEAYTTLVERLRNISPESIPVRKERLRVVVMPKQGIKNPPGEVTKKALTRLGFESVNEVRVGKVYDIEISHPITTEILNNLENMNLKLLSNPVAENAKVGIPLWE